MQRGAAALDFADGLMGRWRAAATAIGAAERRIDDALALALRHETVLRTLHSAVLSGKSVIAAAIEVHAGRQYVRPLQTMVQRVKNTSSIPRQSAKNRRKYD